jgi:hypothetical protein
VRKKKAARELMELWARLLANAMDPNMNNVRQSFIEAVKRMDPLDAVVLRYISENNIALLFLGGHPGASSDRSTGNQNIARAIDHRDDEVEVSIRRLKDLSFFDDHRWVEDHDDDGKIEQLSWWVNAAGREFLRACYPKLSKGERT